MKKNQLIQQNLEDKMIKCLAINTNTNYLAFGHANLVLMTRIAEIVKKYPIKTTIELEKVIISINKPTVKIFLAELPTESTDEDGFEGVAFHNFECREYAIMYYNMLLNSFRDKINSVSHVAISLKNFGEYQHDIKKPRE